MGYRPNRPRRPASDKKIQALRFAGWRYSNKRSAWVHRAFNGRVGPVFVDPAEAHPRIPEPIVIDSAGPRRATDVPVPSPAILSNPLPMRLQRSEIASLPLPLRPLVLGQLRPDSVRVHVRLSASEEPRMVQVDGRPPRRGVDPRSIRQNDSTVVPFKPRRATG